MAGSLRLRAVIPSALMLLLGCSTGKSTLTSTDGQIATVIIDPATRTARVGDAFGFTATIQDGSGNPIEGAQVTWSSSNSNLVSVDQAGQASAKAVGNALVIVAAGEQADTSAVQVQAAPPVAAASVTVAPPTATIAPAATVQLSATVRDAAGTVLIGRALAWRSTNAAVATVSTGGLVTGIAAGTSMVIVTTEAVADTATITVTAAPPPPPPPPPSTGDLVAFPTAAHAAIMGPQLKSGNARNPYPWFDSHGITMGRRVAQEFLQSPVFPASEAEGRNYYDQALVHYITYYRTGDPAFLGYARAIADAWWKYPYINEGRAPTDDNNMVGRQVQLGGLMLRALDGRPEMWPYIVSWGRDFYDTWLGMRIGGSQLHYGVRDGGYTLLYVAWIAQAHPDAAIRAEFKQKALVAARDYYARLQYADGSWRWRETPGDGSVPRMQPFMIGLLLEAMIEVHEMTGDEAVKQAILKSVTNLYTGPSYRRGTYRHFWYMVYGAECDTPTAPACGGDLQWGLASERQLNTLAAHAFGYAYKISGDAKYLTWGDEFFDATYGGSDGTRASLGWVKEYNQGYRSAGRYLAWRIGG